MRDVPLLGCNWACSQFKVGSGPSCQLEFLPPPPLGFLLSNKATPSSQANLIKKFVTLSPIQQHINMSAEIVSHDPHAPDNEHDDFENGAAAETRGVKRPRPSAAAADDDDDDEDKQGRERRKIEIKFIQDKSRRHITFSKRKAGIMKKVRVLPTRRSYV